MPIRSLRLIVSLATLYFMTPSQAHAQAPSETSKTPPPVVQPTEQQVETAAAKKPDAESKPDEKSPWYSVHGQATVVSQGNGLFRSPYAGPLSLQSRVNYRTTETTTLFLAARPWEGTEIIFNPEAAGGVGVSGSSGLAGFPNGEATRVGAPSPTPYFARVLWKQTIGLGGEQETIEDGANLIAGKRDIDRITIRVGKMAATDSFDENLYSHDPRTQFMNWSLMFNGAWDYPANVRGYTYGGSIELNRKTWAFRYGLFAEPFEANGAMIDPHILRANGHVWELEERYTIGEKAGKLRFLAYLNNARMGDYRAAIAAMPTHPDITTVRDYSIKYGFGLNWEQAITDDVGVFARAGWNDGKTESWAFTEIDRTVSGGVLIKGTRWQRPNDTVGVAVVINGLSGPHRDYLAAGGIGFIIGDGRLNYAPEQIVELFYNLKLAPAATLGLGFQGINNPAYNQDRGPAALGAVRLHYEF